MRLPLVPVAAVLDLTCVTVFVVVGRASHGEGDTPVGILGTLWPFALALVVGWIATLAWRDPLRILPVGLGVWAVTAGGGLLLRMAGGDGAPMSFAIVTALFLAATLLGWRTIARLTRSRTPADTPS
ncbi:energy-coupling factor transporter transmembrane protein EcfT [Nocardiopsis mwathae]|uniref:Energy-coupling factor transporter transmembrane protein EcfT n=1 Tax=Nocardiopsis mwathae TaxID=1472723 RepID=A0A7W9YKQ6_9ACTN|nr:DUF3054 domain-containing protein [Nocardiopsis mwathae]MBB6173311.1 energy-coupling factor transporter transmembrane protein EcfT [Nocardiopsis mwathae]